MSDQFKVAIAGGGLAGLALAVHLETLGIDWILLEAYEEIAPELGASIGLPPMACRSLTNLASMTKWQPKQALAPLW
uniref:FAD-binding domain-containing protein n=1 Tax=Bionectria ochroleuca TaxID=29856 RepID=A0A8H7N435_BIOOC